MSNARAGARAGMGRLHHPLFAWVAEAASWPGQARAGSGSLRQEIQAAAASTPAGVGSNSATSHLRREHVGGNRVDQAPLCTGACGLHRPDLSRCLGAAWSGNTLTV